MLHAVKPTVCLCIVVLVCVGGVSCLPKVKPTFMQLPDGQRIEARQVRIWVYELTSSLAGQVELAADEIMATDEDPRVRRAALEWKAAAVPALDRASFQPDPIVALADIWLLVVQMRNLAQTEHGRKMTGDHHALFVETTRHMEELILEFIRDKGAEPKKNGTYDLMHDYAAAHPIETSISTRPTAAPALTDRLRSGKIGAFAAVGSLVEGFTDLSDRLSIYGEQLPKQARWQAEILLWDKGIESVDVEALLADTARLGRAADHLVQFSDEVPMMIDERIEELVPRIEELIESVDIGAIETTANAMIAAHLEVALAAVTQEREAAIEDAMEAVHEERIAAFDDAERMANDIVDRSFERVETMIQASLSGLIPLGAALVAVFALGLLTGLLLRRRAASG